MVCQNRKNKYTIYFLITIFLDELKVKCGEFLKLIASYPPDLERILTEEDIREQEELEAQNKAKIDEIQANLEVCYQLNH